MSKRWSYQIFRRTKNQLNADSLQTQMDQIAGAFHKNSQRGLKAKASAGIEPEETKDGFIYTAEIKVVKKSFRSEEAAERHFAEAKVLSMKVAQRHGWEEEIGGKTPRGPIEVRQNLDFNLPELTTHVYKHNFGRIYEREPHIRTIYKAALTAVRTRFEKRRHTLLYGFPACAKSEVFSAFQRWFNEAGDHVLSLDATTTTKAGIERLLLARAEAGDLPPFLLLEEIEKHDIGSLLSLLQVMDHRGKIQRTNAREGNVGQTAKIVVWATCNDTNKLRNFEGGALWSRFNLRLWCARPSPQLMEKILLREAAEMGANPKCVKKILKFGFEELQTTDPREFTALLDGWEDIDAYLNDQRTIMKQKKEDEATVGLTV